MDYTTKYYYSKSSSVKSPLLLALVVVLMLFLPVIEAHAEGELFLPAKQIYLTPDDDGPARKAPASSSVQENSVKKEAPLKVEKMPVEKKASKTDEKEQAPVAQKEVVKKEAVKSASKKTPAKTVRKEAAQKKAAPTKVAAKETKSTSAQKTVEKMVMELAGDTVLIHLMTNSPVQKSRFFFTSTGKLVVDITGRWHKKGPSKLEFAEGPVADIVTGEHADKFRVVLRWKKQPENKVLPILQVTDAGMSIIVPVPSFQ